MVSHHRVYTSARNAPEQFGFAKARYITVPLGRRLADDRHVKTVFGEVFTYDGNPDMRAVNIGIAGDKYNIRPVPA
jgi:hypothetical protein